MKSSAVILVLAACAGLTSSAIAMPTHTGPVSATDDGPTAGSRFSIVARSASGGFASWYAPSDWSPDGAPIELRDNRGGLLGSFSIGNEQFRTGVSAFINVGIHVTAGESETTILITDFFPLSQPHSGLCGRLYGNATLTDETRNGAALFGEFANGKTVGAFINGIPASPGFPGTGGVIVKTAIDDMTADPEGSTSQPFDSSCFELPGVDGLGLQWSFRLSAFDSLAADATFEIGKCCTVPLPSGAAMGLAGVGLIAGVRRRR